MAVFWGQYDKSMVLDSTPHSERLYLQYSEAITPCDPVIVEDPFPLQKFSCDILRIILHHLVNEDYRDARLYRQVCKAWDKLLKHRALGTLQICISQPRKRFNQETFEHIQGDVELHRLIDAIIVTEWFDSNCPPVLEDLRPQTDWLQTGKRVQNPNSRASTLDQILDLAGFIGTLRLKRFRWQAIPRIPESIIAQLRRQQQCSVDIISTVSLDRYLWPPDYMLSVMDNLVSLNSYQSIPCLRRLSVSLLSTKRFLFRALQEALTFCHHLQEVSIYAISRLHNTEDNVFIYDWPFETPEDGSKIIKSASIHTVELFNICICQTDTSLWYDLVEWSRLTSATFTCPCFLIDLSDYLKQLRALRLQMTSFPWISTRCHLNEKFPPLRASLAEFRHLQELELTNGTDLIDDDLLSNIGRNLLVLKVHEDDPDSRDYRRQAIIAPQIRSISRHCPQLQCLAVDLDLLPDYSLETLRLIAECCAYVHHLKLNFDIRRERSLITLPRTSIMQPQITRNTAVEIFEYVTTHAICKNIQNSGSFGLQIVEISAGSFARPDLPVRPYPGRRAFSNWVSPQIFTFVLRYQNGSRPYAADLLARCPELEVLENVRRELAESTASLRFRHRRAEKIVRASNSNSDPSLVLKLSSILRSLERERGKPNRPWEL